MITLMNEQGKAKRKTITIPAPIAKVGDRVLVHNYRMKGNKWEEGELRSAEFCFRFTGEKGWWHYDVWVKRENPDDPYAGISLYVGDDGIEAITQRKDQV